MCHNITCLAQDDGMMVVLVGAQHRHTFLKTLRSTKKAQYYGIEQYLKKQEKEET